MSEDTVPRVNVLSKRSARSAVWRLAVVMLYASAAVVAPSNERVNVPPSASVVNVWTSFWVVSRDPRAQTRQRRSSMVEPAVS